MIVTVRRIGSSGESKVTGKHGPRTTPGCDTGIYFVTITIKESDCCRRS